FWQRELPAVELSGGAFGENLTVEGLLESEVRIGDRFGIGSAEVLVTQPRVPCFKLGIRLGRDDIVERFLRSGRSGFYLAVIREGSLQAGDEVERLERGPASLTIAAIAHLYRDQPTDAASRELMTLAAATPSLAESWREYFLRRLERP